MPSVLIADDHPLFRDAMRLAVEAVAADDPLAVLEAGTLAEVDAIASAEPGLDLSCSTSGCRA